LMWIGVDDGDDPTNSRIQPTFFRLTSRILVVRADGVWAVHGDRFLLCLTN
jgi:hypothetical protein